MQTIAVNPDPVRANTPQRFDYVFRDGVGAPIDLTTYTTVTLEVKLQGLSFATVSGYVVSPTAGTVRVDSYTFTTPGVWQFQFKCVDGGGKELFGLPMQTLVVKNVEDAGTTELLKY